MITNNTGLGSSEYYEIQPIMYPGEAPSFEEAIELLMVHSVVAG